MSSGSAQHLARTSIRLWASLIAITSFAPFAAIAVLATSGARRYVFVVVCVTIAAWLVVARAWRVDFVVAPNGVVIRNFWRTYAFDWDEVKALGPGGSVGQLRAVAFVMKDGRVHSVQASSYSKELRRTALGMAETFAPEAVEIRNS